MAPREKLFRGKREFIKNKNSNASQFNKKTLFLRFGTQVTLFSGYIVLNTDDNQFVIADIMIDTVLIPINSTLKIETITALSKRFKTVIVDKRGYFIGEVFSYAKK